MSWFGGSKDERDTRALLSEANRLRAMSRFQSEEAVHQYLIDLFVEVCDESDLCIAAVVAQPLGDICLALISAEAFCYDPAPNLDPAHLSLKVAATLRARLRSTIKTLSNEAYHLAEWRSAIKAILLAIVSQLPVNALCDPAPDGSVEHISVLSPTTPLYTLVDELPLILTQIYCTLGADDLAEAGMFDDLREQFNKRLALASGIPWLERYSSKRPIQLPVEKDKLSAPDLLELYTTETLFEGFFQTPVPIPIPADVRFEHTHILGGTGHGKTQLLQYLIADDLSRALDEPLSLVVFDPDGTLIRTITHTDYFGPLLFQDRCLIIDPSDIDHPVSLNLFDVSHVETSDARTRETIQNNTIELFEYFFDALLGSELTGKQTTLFRYLGLLLVQIPNANIHTLRQLMENGSAFKPYMERLTGSARIFFETRFFDKSLNETKKQILTRLWGVLSSQSLDRIFSATRNSINFDMALRSGKMIFIHTSKEYLGEEGSHIFARMMVALISQAMIRRAGVAPDQRTPVYIYIDEAEGVVDQTLVRMLAQVRKYRGAITFAHQHLDQLSASNRAGVLANTSIKLAGGMSAKDASALAPEFRTNATELLSEKKRATETDFALFAKNITPASMRFTVPLGYVEGIDQLTAPEYADLLANSREQVGQRYDAYDAVFDDVPDQWEAALETDTGRDSDAQTEQSGAELDAAIDTPASAPIYRKEGGGGVRHAELERMVKELGEVAGYRASVEETILDGAGRVDVILRRGAEIICAEISVTTTREHELLNVRKCLEFGATTVLVVASNGRHLKGLANYIGGHLGEVERGQVEYLSPDALPEYFATLTKTSAPMETVVRGYRVVSSTRANPTKAGVRNSLNQIFR